MFGVFIFQFILSVFTSQLIFFTVNTYVTLD